MFCYRQILKTKEKKLNSVSVSNNNVDIFAIYAVIIQTDESNALVFTMQCMCCQHTSA